MRTPTSDNGYPAVRVIYDRIAAGRQRELAADIERCSGYGG
jgi:hypothetical protein